MSLPSGFVYLNDINSNIIQEMKYFTSDNFIGRKIKGYEAPVCITLKEIANALSGIQASLEPKGLGLKVFDCYRPQMSVDEFVIWSQDLTDQKMKASHYPNIDKRDFFKLQYVAAKSAHTRGSAVDLTIIDRVTKVEFDMGTPFDFMDGLSHPLNESITGVAKENRLLLRSLMVEAGFEPLETEWWHFRYIEEPFPESYFNFPIK